MHAKSINMHKCITELFDSLPISKTCTWPGTKWVGEGTKAKILPCGEPTVGAGHFCDPTYKDCEYHSLCERHSKRKLESWGKVDG